MVIESIQSSTFRSRFALNSTFSALRKKLGVDLNFAEDISAAFAEGQSPASDEPFDLALNVDNSALGALGNAFNGNRKAGVPVDVSGGTVTFEAESGTDKLVVTPFQNVTIRKGAENALTVFNETTGEALRLAQGKSLEVTGGGQAELVAGDGKNLRLEEGEAVTLSEEDGSLKLEESTFRKTLELSGGSRQLAAVGAEGENVTLFTGASESLQFDAGQTGDLSKTDSGSLKITNRATGESLVVDSRETLKAQGNAEVAIGSDPSFEIEEGDKVTVTEDSDGLQLENQSVAESVSFPRSGGALTEDPLGGISNQIDAQAETFQTLLNTRASSLSLAGSDLTNSTEDRFGGVNDVIEPFSKREASELTQVGLPIDEENQSAFFTESQVPEPFEELPSLLFDNETTNSVIDEGDGGFMAFGEDEEDFSIFDKSSDSILASEDDEGLSL